MDGTKYCSSCGTQMDENINNCPECGINQTARYEKSVRYEKGDIDYVAASFGLITAVVLYVLSFFSFIVLPAFLTGLVAGFFVNSNNSAKCVLYGIVTSLIGLSIGYAVINSILGNFMNLIFQPSIGELFIVSIGMGAIGGFLGYYINKLLST